MTTLEQVAGWSALIAAVATVIGAVTLMVFFARGGWWGLANDLASIVLMIAMIPVAFAIAAMEDGPAFPGLAAWLVATIGILSMVLAAGFQVALVTRMRSFQELLPKTLAAGAGVGVWYVLVGLLGFTTLGPPLSVLAILAGLGFIAIGYGFRIGGQRHPAAAIGGAVLFVSSMVFLTWLGVLLVTGIVVIEPFVGTL
jgi:hypothetical protein